jgi:hypothetical protein
VADLDVFGPRAENLRDPGTRLHLVERFSRVPGINGDIGIAYNLDFEVLGTNAVSADVTLSTRGGIAVASHGAATDSTIILPHLDAAQTSWATATPFATAKEPEWGCTIETNSALTNTTIWAGCKLTNTPVVATDNDQVIFRYQNGTDTNWQATYSVGGTDVTVDTGVAVAVSTQYRLWLTVDSGRKCRFWINGKVVATSTALTSLTTLIPYIGVLSATDATAKTIFVRNCWASRNY